MKQQFDLSLWLQDKSRKVVTRRGNPVRIICTDRKHGEDKLPIVFLEENNEGECLWICKSDGRSDNYDTQYDLFFADEELSDFEKGLVDLVSGWCDSHIETPEEYINKHSQTLLDLARKELLKDFPMWKKAKKDEELDCHVAIQQDGRVVLSDFVQKDEYYITLDVLKKLPKEE